MIQRLTRALLVIWLAAMMVSVCMPAAVGVATGAAWAQDPAQPPNYADWDRQAAQIEDIVASGDANDKRLQSLRAQVVAWREGFLAAKGVNSGRIGTVKDQISALGPAPSEGDTEAEDVAARRKELTATLAELQAPGIQAVEAASRASGIIQSIDKLQRERQTSALLHLSPSPLLPTSWAAATRDGWTVSTGLATEVAARFGDTTPEQWRSRLPTVAAYLIAAILLLIAGRRWIGSFSARLSAQASDSSREAVEFMVSLGQIAVPALGIYLAVRGADASELFGEWGRPVLIALPMAALALLSGIWLVRRFFPAHGQGPMEIPDAMRSRVRRLGVLLAAALAVHMIQSRTGVPLSGIPFDLPGAARFPVTAAEAAAAVWHLPVIAVGALLMFRLGAILRRAVSYDSSDQTAFRVRMIALIGSLLRPLAVLVLVLALIGYVSLANGLLWPATRTVALLGLLILLQNFITNLYGMVLRDQNLAKGALAPVLIGFLLVLASVPVFALIWGARPSDLLEAWTRIRQGVSLGGVRLSPGAVLTFFLVFVVGYVLTRMAQNAVRVSVLPRTRIDSGGQNAIVSGLGYLGIMLATVFAIISAGIDLSSLAIVAGALSVGIGFGLQNIVSNFISGIILLIERPIAVGDWIRAGTAEGYVKRISVRSTQIQTFDRTDIIVPNSDLITESVTNWTRGSLQGRIIVAVSVAYGSDTRRVSEILTEIAEDQPTVLINPAPYVVFSGFGDDGMDFEVRAILSDINQGLGVSTEIRHQIVERFAAEEIEIPFSRRNVTIRNVDELSRLTRPMQAAQASGAPRHVEHPAQNEEGLDPRIASATASGIEALGDSDGDQR